MKIYAIPFLAFLFALKDNSVHVKTVKYCNREYIETRKKVFLKEENLNTVMVQVNHPETKKFVFGYFESAVRNDTNFIYSRLSFNNDTIIRTDHHLYRIDRGMDSSVAKFICTKKGLLLYSHTRYLNGQVKGSTIHNYLMDY